MPASPTCPCNGCLMLPERRGGYLVSYWCPHMERGQVDAERHLRWQELNKVPAYLCKVRRVPAHHSNNPTTTAP